MNSIQLRYGEHKGDRKSGEARFQGGAVYWLWLKDTIHNGTKVVTEYPFYAMGFDQAGAGSPQFGIKIFGEDVQYINMPSGNSPAQFVGWISDGEAVNEFEIVALPGNTILHSLAFTNVAYATHDDVSLRALL